MENNVILVQKDYRIFTKKEMQYCFEEDRIHKQNIPNQIFQNSICNICQFAIARDPVQCLNCSKVYGANCIKECQNCPCCRHSFINKQEKIQFIQLPLQNNINFDNNNINDNNDKNNKQKLSNELLNKMRNIYVRDTISATFKTDCIHKVNGCQQVLQCEDQIVTKHEFQCEYKAGECSYRGCNFKGIGVYQHMQQCQYKIEECKYFEFGCEWRGRLKLLEGHILQCEFQQVQCQNGNCQQKLLKKDIQRHNRGCQYANIDCIYKNCQWKGFKKDLNQHKLQCDYRPVKCRICSQQISFKEFQKHELQVCQLDIDNFDKYFIGPQNYKESVEYLDSKYKNIIKKQQETINQTEIQNQRIQELEEQNKYLQEQCNINVGYKILEKGLKFFNYAYKQQKKQ